MPSEEAGGQADFDTALGGMAVTGAQMDFSSPEAAVGSFMQALAMQDFDAVQACLVEGAEDLEDLRRILTEPQSVSEAQMRLCFESLGPPVEVLESIQDAHGVHVRWLATVTRDFSIREGGGEMTWVAGDRFELDARFVQVGQEWKMAGM